MADDQPPIIKSENERLGNHAPANPANPAVETPAAVSVAATTATAAASPEPLVAPITPSSNSTHTSDRTVAQAQAHALNTTSYVDDQTTSTTPAVQAKDLTGPSSSHHHAKNNLSFAPKDNLYEIDTAAADSPTHLAGITRTTSGTNEGYSIYSNVKDGKVPEQSFFCT